MRDRARRVVLGRRLRKPVVEPVAPPSANDVIAVLNAQNEKIFTLAVISTAVGGVAAMLAIYRTVKSLREG